VDVARSYAPTRDALHIVRKSGGLDGNGGVATLAQWRCRGVDNGKEGPWRWWAYRGVVGGATSTRWRSKRAAVGMSQRCRGGRHGSSCAALTGQEGSGVGLKKRSDNQHVVGGGVWQGAGVGGGTVSARVDVFVQQ
jgi:hypothetical protein